MHVQSLKLAVAVVVLAGLLMPPAAAQEISSCMLARDRLIVPVRINGVGPYPFLLSAQTQQPAIDPAVAEFLGLTPVRHLTVGEDSEQTDVPVVELEELEAPGLPAEPKAAGVISLAQLASSLGTRLSGVMPAHQPGYETLIDWEKPEVRWQALAAEVEAPSEHTQPLRVSEAGVPLVEVKVDGGAPIWCEIDLQRSAALALPQDVLESAGVLTEETERLILPLEDGGERILVRASFRTGGARMGNASCEVLLPGEAPALGLAFLSRFSLRLNYEFGICALEPREGAVLRMPPLTGCGVFPAARTPRGWRILVAYDSPAGRMGLRTGDLLLTVGLPPQPTAPMAPHVLEEALFAAPGATTRLIIGREDGAAPFDVTARPLF